MAKCLGVHIFRENTISCKKWASTFPYKMIGQNRTVEKETAQIKLHRHTCWSRLFCTNFLQKEEEEEKKSKQLFPHEEAMMATFAEVFFPILTLKAPSKICSRKHSKFFFFFFFFSEKISLDISCELSV